MFNLFKKKCTDKYEMLENDTIVYNGRKLYRIRALKSFSYVSEGSLGGYIERESNLSQCGNCWINNSSIVYGNAIVDCDANVNGSCIISGNSNISGHSSLNDAVILDGDIKILGDTSLCGIITVTGNVTIVDSHISIEKLSYIKSENACIRDSNISDSVVLIDCERLDVYKIRAFGISVNINNNKSRLRNVIFSGDVKLLSDIILCNSKILENIELSNNDKIYVVQSMLNKEDMATLIKFNNNDNLVVSDSSLDKFLSLDDYIQKVINSCNDDESVFGISEFKDFIEVKFGIKTSNNPIKRSEGIKDVIDKLKCTDITLNENIDKSIAEIYSDAVLNVLTYNEFIEALLAFIELRKNAKN